MNITKLFKAGKNWLIATMTVAAVTIFASVIVRSNVKADTLNSKAFENNTSIQLAD